MPAFCIWTKDWYAVMVCAHETRSSASYKVGGVCSVPSLTVHPFSDNSKQSAQYHHITTWFKAIGLPCLYTCTRPKSHILVAHNLFSKCIFRRNERHRGNCSLQTMLLGSKISAYLSHVYHGTWLWGDITLIDHTSRQIQATDSGHQVDSQ